MARAYSMDLRERLVRAVDEQGMSRHAAAARFGVAVSTAVKVLQRYQRTGSAAPGWMGGRRPRAIVGADREWLLHRCADSNFTLRGLIGELAARGLTVGYRAVWNFVHAEGLSFKKNRARRRAGSARCRSPSGAMAQLPGAD